MATKSEMLIEANRRGLLTGQQKIAFDEAVSRGLIQLPADEIPKEQLPTQVASPQSMREFAERAQSTVQYPGAESAIGAAGQGFVRGMEQVGEGLMQRYYDVKEFFGGDTGEERRRLELSRNVQEQKYKPTSEEYPVSSFAGEVAGSVAAVPTPASTIRGAAALGGAFGASQYLESGEGLGDFAQNVASGAALGGVAQAAAPYIQRGFNKTRALFSGLYKQATGLDPRPEMFMPDGTLSDSGRTAMDNLGITEDDFARIYQTVEPDLNPEQAMRLARAQEQGIPLTTGQVTKDFGTQEAEQTLMSGLGRESEAARRFAESQQEGISEAADRFSRQFGEPSTSRGERGQIVQQAIRGEKETQAKTVRALYDTAAKTAGSDVPITPDQLVDNAYDLVMSRPVEQPVVDALERTMAKFGLIGDEVTKKGRFSNVVTDDGKSIQIRGEVTPLNLSNAEEFRQALNQILPSDRTGAISGVIRTLDSQVDSLLSKAPAGTQRQQAFEAARSATREMKRTFNQKDIIESLAGFKKGTQTDLISPEIVMDKIYQGKVGIDNLKKVKNVLMRNPTNKSLDAWKSIQAQGVADIFSQSINPTDGAFSGQRLSTAIKRFGSGSMEEGERKLKFLLGDKYKEFNNLRMAIGDATIPVKGTTNPSGTAYKLLNFMTRVGTVGSFGADTVLSLAGKAKDAARSRRILKSIETASPERVKQAVKANDELIDSFIALGAQRAASSE